MPATGLQARNLAPSLTVSDVQRSLRFYTEGLGFATGGDLGWGSIGFTLTDPDGYKLTISRE